MQEVIEIPTKISGEEVVFKFNPMPVEEAAEWGSRMKARSVFREGLLKRMSMIEEMDPVDRDMDEYFALADKEAGAVKSITKVAMQVSEYLVEPARERVDELTKKDLEGVLSAFTSFISTLFPTEEESKN